MSLVFGDDMFCQYAVSRAVDEDYDDEECTDEPSFQPFIWRPSPGMDTNSTNGSISCTSLIIAIGPVCAGFIEAHVLDSNANEVIGRLVNDPSHCSDDDASVDRCCVVCRLTAHPNVLIVQCRVTVTPEQSYSFTQQLMSSLYLPSAHVVILSTGNRSEYKCELPPADIPYNFLRMLHSHAYRGSLACAPVEQPNTVDGLPAQLLTYCQIHRMSCTLYVCYSNTLNVDLDMMKAFDKVLRTEPFSQLSKGSGDVDKRLSKLVQQIHSANQSRSFIYL
jgi:hypothetical protein